MSKSYYRCSECRKPVGAMVEMFMCPYTRRGATADKCEDWGAIRPMVKAPQMPYKLLFDPLDSPN